MPVFVYKGLDASGKSTNGIIDADSPKLARIKLRKSGIFPTDLSEEQQQSRAIARGAILDETLTGCSAEQIAGVSSDIVERIFRQNISMGKGMGLMAMVQVVQAMAAQLAGARTTPSQTTLAPSE